MGSILYRNNAGAPNRYGECARYHSLATLWGVFALYAF